MFEINSHLLSREGREEGQVVSILFYFPDFNLVRTTVEERTDVFVDFSVNVGGTLCLLLRDHTVIEVSAVILIR